MSPSGGVDRPGLVKPAWDGEVVLELGRGLLGYYGEVLGLPGRVRESFLEEASLHERTGSRAITWESKVGWAEDHCRQKGTVI